MEEDLFIGLPSNGRLEYLSWCWRFLQSCATDVCDMHIKVASCLVDQLAIEGEFHRLRQFISNLSLDEYAVLYGNEKFNKAMIRLYVEEANYVNALCLLKSCATDVCDMHIKVASCLVDQLAIEGEFHRLRQFIANLSLDEYAVLYGNERFNKAMIRLYVEEANYVNALCLLKNAKFEEKDESLIRIWDDIQYKLEELRKGRSLTSLDRFRVRKRNPPPPSIRGEEWRRISSRLPQKATHLLRLWLNQHVKRPYPNREQSEQLARQSGLSIHQVKLWFANARRNKQKRQSKTRGCQHIEQARSNHRT
ncbi:hypothetical protein EGW08_009533 [Elysia chlorotica]|uniref:Homeobox domain-containing protein n=1 Tax=Elysia chlorotica TaxID=188477 RepID=A0A3S1BFC0_ELYCH|nr:hypothetical protein EGW08_009533 [Elysia chlorotica]